MKNRCIYCKPFRIHGTWECECQNSDSEWYGEYCVERDRYEPQECGDKVEETDEEDF